MDKSSKDLFLSNAFNGFYWNSQTLRARCLLLTNVSRVKSVQKSADNICTERKLTWQALNVRD